MLVLTMAAERRHQDQAANIGHFQHFADCRPSSLARYLPLKRLPFFRGIASEFNSPKTPAQRRVRETGGLMLLSQGLKNDDPSFTQVTDVIFELFLRGVAHQQMKSERLRTRCF